MARPTIENIRGLGDMMVSNLWELSFTSPAQGDPDGILSELNTMNFRAVSFEIPKRTGNSLEISIRGHKVKQPGDYDYSGSVTLTLVETEDTTPVHRLINTWREAIISTNANRQERKRDIEVTAIIQRLDRRNNPIPGLVWALVGVYLEDYELGDLNDTGDIIQPTITLSYDYFIEGDAFDEGNG